MKIPDLEDYVRRILTSAVYDVATETPLKAMPQLSTRLGVRILLKREDLQPVFSFKIRGAQNKLAALEPVGRAAGVICASAGNHAQGVALSASRFGTRAVIVMPTTTPTIKVRGSAGWAEKLSCTAKDLMRPERTPWNWHGGKDWPSIPMSSPARASSGWRVSGNTRVKSERSMFPSAVGAWRRGSPLMLNFSDRK